MAGGKRPGAGRPVGSKNKLTLRDYMKEEDIKEFFEFVLGTYKESEKLTIWMGDQLVGKATQALTGPDGGPIEIKGVTISVRRK
jgi:hypothetical protein